MADVNWNISDNIENLSEAPGEWSFYQALRAIECAMPDKPRIGDARTPEDNAVKLTQKPELAFKGCDIESYDQKTGKLAVNCFGLYGANGPMPLYFTEYVYQRCRQSNDKTMLNLLDIFQNRLIALFYKAWAVFEPTVSSDREEDYFLEIFKSFIGICNTRIKSDSKYVPGDESRVYYSGYLMQKVQSIENLKAVLSDYFDIPVEISSFAGTWFAVGDEYHAQIGRKRSSEILGCNAMLGRKVKERVNNFIIRIGPMELWKYKKLLPGTEGFIHLLKWIKRLTPPNLEFAINFVLKAEEVAQSRKGSQLGYTSWLNSEAEYYDREDLIISAEDIRNNVNKEALTDVLHF